MTCCTEPNPIHLPPTPDMITNMEQAFSWMKWLTVQLSRYARDAFQPPDPETHTIALRCLLNSPKLRPK